MRRDELSNPPRRAPPFWVFLGPFFVVGSLQQHRERCTLGSFFFIVLALHANSVTHTESSFFTFMHGFVSRRDAKYTPFILFFIFLSLFFISFDAYLVFARCIRVHVYTHCIGAPSFFVLLLAACTRERGYKMIQKGK